MCETEDQPDTDQINRAYRSTEAGAITRQAIMTHGKGKQLKWYRYELLDRNRLSQTLAKGWKATLTPPLVYGADIHVLFVKDF